MNVGNGFFRGVVERTERRVRAQHKGPSWPGIFILILRHERNRPEVLAQFVIFGVSYQAHDQEQRVRLDRKSTRLNSSHRCISYAVFCLKKKTKVDLVP